MKAASLSLFALLFSCVALAQSSPSPSAKAPVRVLTEGEMAQQDVTWEKPVIIYNRALGREVAVKLRERLQPYLRDKIGLYPCQKEGAMDLPLPESCTRIFLDLNYHYDYEGRKGGQGAFYRIGLGCSDVEWRRDRPVSRMRAHPAHVSCVIPRGQEDEVFERLLRELRPHMAPDAEGKLRLQTIRRKDFRDFQQMCR